jgi:hypothetical protein
MPVQTEKKVEATVALSGAEWELYTSSMNCAMAVKGLNATFNRLIKANPNCDEASANAVHEGMLISCERFSEYGAYDAESRWQVRNVIRKVYGVSV